MFGQPLEKNYRNKLEQTIKEARNIGETAANASLNQIGVGHAVAYNHLSPEERKLRVKLRVHSRQLGDRLGSDQTQETTRLVEEVAYQHWHRMLFARFLAENQLLMDDDPDHPVAVSLNECNELASEDSTARNGWELAARYATRMLPQIFRVNSPVFELSLPLEHQQKLEKLLENLPTEVFTATDSLGWVYQYWQSQRKEEVNASEVKIGARELPAVTQLFTEPYMVSFLLDNSLGAWWAARRLNEDDLNMAGSEEELRQKAALDGVPLEYLRFVREDNGLWAPAAGTFDQWPEHLNELKMMDPCCGSGHFVVSTFQMLVPMRMELEGLSATEAIDAVIQDNIHGLEIDERCVEIAAFASAFAAWRYPGAGGYRKLPEFNLACSGLSVSVPKDTWRKIARNNTQLRLALDVLHDYFQQAPLLGSLLNPARSEAAMLVEWPDLVKGMERALHKEPTEEEYEAGVAASGLAKAGELLAKKYEWIITNVPYLGIRGQCEILREYCKDNYILGRHDLATVFLLRLKDMLSKKGFCQMVIPNNWLFSSSYIQFRLYLLETIKWHYIAKLGSGAFETISGEVVKVLLFAFTKTSISKNHLIYAYDVSNAKLIENKAELLKSIVPFAINQKEQINNPDHRIIFDSTSKHPLLEEYTISLAGIQNGDSFRFLRNYWEHDYIFTTWWPIQSAVYKLSLYDGMHFVINYDCENGHLNELRQIRRDKLHDSDQRGRQAWGKRGIFVSRMSDLYSTLYIGNLYDQSGAVLLPKDEKKLLPIYAYVTSSDYANEVRKIDNKVNVTNATLAKVPFDLEHWQKVADEKYPFGLPAPFSDDPTQWIFHGHPCGSVVFNEQTGLLEQGPIRTNHTVLQVAVARLLGYRWPAESDHDMELSAESRTWIRKCNELERFTDQEGIVCIPPVRGEAAAVDRLIDLLAAAYGDRWRSDTLATLLEQADHAGKTFETWLRDKFFMQHCKLFQHRPFIWQIWDGLPDGFSALVNYHKLTHKNLETLIYTYLGDWIKRQKQDQASGIDGAAEKIAAAENLKKSLELILEGEAPLDIFARWKPLETQPVGWNPDFNDGVRLNIRPFLFAPPVRKNGAGVLRDKPNIKWEKDRGKDVPSAPWYHLHKGERINDHHLSLKEKREAQDSKQDYSLAVEEGLFSIAEGESNNDHS